MRSRTAVVFSSSRDNMNHGSITSVRKFMSRRAEIEETGKTAGESQMDVVNILLKTHHNGDCTGNGL